MKIRSPRSPWIRQRRLEQRRRTEAHDADLLYERPEVRTFLLGGPRAGDLSQLPALGEHFQPLQELPPAPVEPLERDRLPEPEGVLQGWWRKALDALQGRAALREVGRARRVVEAVRALEPRYRAMSDLELRSQTESFKGIIGERTEHERSAVQAATRALDNASWEDRAARRADLGLAEEALYKAEQRVLDALLPEAFAVAREAAFRATGQFPFERQILSGALMHRGLIAEMYTGEGKTLAAVMPAYLSALAGHGFHVITVNDYLAKRDATEMGVIYDFLGLSIGVIQNQGRQFSVESARGGGGLRPITRKEAYLRDITYGTAAEFGFDYLKDNGVRDLSMRVQRPLYGVLIDEVDAILIDEARTPLIIAGPGDDPDRESLHRYRDIVRDLRWEARHPKDEIDVEWVQEENWVSLTDKGYKTIMRKLDLPDLFAPANLEKLRMIQEALQAQFLLRRDEDYAVLDGKVINIGKNGHALAGRRFTQGLHQALEAKEGVEILPYNFTHATVTMREYIALYKKRAGMTGTALSARDPLNQVYGFDVARVPTRKDLIRVDYPDAVFRTREEKTRAMVSDIVEGHIKGRPILVGVEWTRTAEELAEQVRGALAKALRAGGTEITDEEVSRRIQVLTAKNDGEEAEIIANAGRLGAVTIATARGGRGVDIKLGGSERIHVEELIAQGFSEDRARAMASGKRAKERAAVLARGGLLVMGYEHFDSRRRDDQLRGRAGRQGDPGATIFFTSLEDPLFDGIKDAERMRNGEIPFDHFEARQITERALEHSEGRVNDALARSVPYDKVFGLQREKFYALREDALSVPDCREVVHAAIQETIERAFENVDLEKALRGSVVTEEVARALHDRLREFIPLPEHGPSPAWSSQTLRQIRDDVEALVGALLAKREEAVGEEINRVLERAAFLEALDESWILHLDGLMNIQEGILLRAWGQRDPRLEFQRVALDEYRKLLAHVRTELAGKVLMNMPFIADGRPPPRGPSAGASQGEGAPPDPVLASGGVDNGPS